MSEVRLAHEKTPPSPEGDSRAARTDMIEVRELQHVEHDEVLSYAGRLSQLVGHMWGTGPNGDGIDQFQTYAKLQRSLLILGIPWEKPVRGSPRTDQARQGWPKDTPFDCCNRSIQQGP